MAKFKTVVKRSEWARGRAETALLLKNGKKCCLGFRCEQAGISLVVNAGMPHSLGHLAAELPAWLLDELPNTPVDNAARTNDSMILTDEEREVELREIFASQGEEIEFVD